MGVWGLLCYLYFVESSISMSRGEAIQWGECIDCWRFNHFWWKPTEKVHGFAFGDSLDEYERSKWQDFEARLKKSINLEDFGDSPWIQKIHVPLMSMRHRKEWKLSWLLRYVADLICLCIKKWKFSCL